MNKQKNFLVLVLVFSLCLLLYSSKTNYIIQEGYNTFSNGQLTKTSVNSNGIIYLSNDYEVSDEIDYEIVWDINTDVNDNIYLFTGFDGIVKNQTKNIEFQTELLAAVSSFSDENGELFCGGFAEGYLYKISKDEITKLTILPDSYVWSIREYDAEHLLVGTGSKGNIYKVNKKTGDYDLIIETEFNNITALTKTKDDVIFFGTSESGAVYEYKDGKTSVVINFDGNEIVDIILDEKNESLYIGVNQGKQILLTAEMLQTFDDGRGRQIDANQQGDRQTETINENNEVEQNEITDSEDTLNDSDSSQQPPQQETRQLQPRPPSQPGGDMQGTIYKYSLNGRVKRIYSTGGGYINSFIFSAPNDIYVAVGNMKKLIHIDLKTLIVSDFVSPDGRDFVKIRELKSNKNIIAITKKPVQIYTIRNRMATEGEYISNAIDFEYNAKAGNIQVIPDISSSKLKFLFRNGNTAQPDKHWTDWEKNVLRLEASRYFQYKIILSKDKFIDISPEIRKIIVPYIKPNRSPEVNDFSMAKDNNNNNSSSNGRGAGPSGVSQGGPLTNISPQDVNKSYDITLHWNVSDPDGDILIYNLYYKNLKTDLWVKINDDWFKENNYVLNTKFFEDGYYVFKLEVSDELSNTKENKHIVNRQSDVFLIDNTSPKIIIKDFVINNRQLYFYAEIRDDLSIIKEQFYKLNRDDWKFLLIEDSINDSKSENIKLVIDDLKEGVNTISIVFTDFDDNVGFWTKDFVVD
jgi:hypothetical protein